MRLPFLFLSLFFVNISFAGDNVSYDDLKVLVERNGAELATLKGAVAKLQANVRKQTKTLREQDRLMCALKRENNKLSAYVRIYKEKIAELEKIIVAQNLLKEERKNVDAQKTFIFDCVVKGLEEKIASCEATTLRLRDLVSSYAGSEHCAACQGKIDQAYMATVFR